MMRIILSCILLLVLFHVPGLAGDIIKSGSLQAYSDGSNVTIRWATEDETNVQSYEIERSTGAGGSFVSIGTVDPKGPSLYEFIDNTAFMRTTTIYQYRIKVVFSSGAQPYYTPPLTVSHTVSGVRRTWGSIKAMFR